MGDRLAQAEVGAAGLEDTVASQAATTAPSDRLDGRIGRHSRDHLNHQDDYHQGNQARHPHPTYPAAGTARRASLGSVGRHRSDSSRGTDTSASRPQKRIPGQDSGRGVEDVSRVAITSDIGSSRVSIVSPEPGPGSSSRADPNARPDSESDVETDPEADSDQDSTMSAPKPRRKQANASRRPLLVNNDNNGQSPAVRPGRPSAPFDSVTEAKSAGFLDLPAADKRNFVLLCILYFLQGAPMGFVGSAIPLLPEFRVDYSKVGILSLAMYPYSVKLVWSPIVDAVWSRRLGRRKSWILPVQTLSGFGLLWLGANISTMIDAVHQEGGSGIWGFTAWWILLVFMCATQDIAVDGWAISLLPEENVSYASTAQTVGLTAGMFLCSTVFIPFSSPEFANRWFRTIPQDTGLITLGGALKATGWAYLAVTVGLAVFKREAIAKKTGSVADGYRVMVGILKLADVRTLLLVHLVAKIGFIANDAVTVLKLREKGMSQDDIALMMLIDFPFEIALAYYGGKWSKSMTPLGLWSNAFFGRLAAGLTAQAVIAFYPSGGVNVAYLLVAIVQNVFSTFMSTIMFVAVSAFHAQIADPDHGGTYMTLLATFSNLGGTLPKFFVLKAVDLFTSASCNPPVGMPAADKPFFDSSPSCVYEEEKKACAAVGGTCQILHDGYNWVNVISIVGAAILFVRWIRPTTEKLQRQPKEAWRLPPGAI